MVAIDVCDAVDAVDAVDAFDATQFSPRPFERLRNRVDRTIHTHKRYVHLGCRRELISVQAYNLADKNRARQAHRAQICESARKPNCRCAFMRVATLALWRGLLA